MFKSKAQKRLEAEARFNGNRKALQERVVGFETCGCRNPNNCTTCRGTGVRSVLRDA